MIFLFIFDLFCLFWQISLQLVTIINYMLYLQLLFIMFFIFQLMVMMNYVSFSHCFNKFYQKKSIFFRFLLVQKIKFLHNLPAQMDPHHIICFLVHLRNRIFCSLANNLYNQYIQRLLNHRKFLIIHFFYHVIFHNTKLVELRSLV